MQLEFCEEGQTIIRVWVKHHELLGKTENLWYYKEFWQHRKVCEQCDIMFRARVIIPRKLQHTKDYPLVLVEKNIRSIDN
jgi:hypothetical protein